VGYFEFFAAINIVLGLRTNGRKARAVALIYAVPLVMNVVGFAILRWKY
jgi:hypothetical protein